MSPAGEAGEDRAPDIAALRTRIADLEARHDALQRDEAAHRAIAQATLTILDALPAHLALVNSLGVIVSVNASRRSFASANVLQSAAFCVGENYLTVCEQAIGECSAEAHDAADGIRLVLRGEQSQFELEYPCHSPTAQHWYRLLVTPLRDGDALGAVIMHVDVSERKLREQALTDAERAARESETRLEFALQAAEIGNWTLDLRTNLSFRSLRHDECFGYTDPVAEWTYETFLAHVHPADQRHVDACFRSAMAGIGEYSVEFRTIWADGSEHWLWTKGQFYRDDAGALVRAAGIVTEITERREADALLLRSEQRLALATASAGIGIWDWHVPRDELVWDEQMYAIYGIRSEDFAGGVNGWQRWVHSADHARLDAETAAALQGTREYHTEFRVVWPSGEVRHVEAHATVQRSADGTAERMIGVNRDITIRRREELAAAQLAAIVESSGDAIIGKDLSGTITSWNPGAEAIFGYSAEEMLGVSILRLIPPERHGEEREILATVGAGRTMASLETQRLTKDGRLIDVSITVSPIRDSAGALVGISKAARDITERKRIEARFRRLVDSSAQGVFFWNMAGAITDANDVFLRMTGYSRGELEEGRLEWTAMTPPEHAALDAAAISQVLATGVCAAYEKEYVRRDGSRVPVLIGAATFEDNPNEGVCFVVDITDRRKLEQQFLRAQRVENIGTLAGGIAHDLNNVLTPIIMSIELLKMTAVDEESLEILDVIHTSARRGADMVQQVLSFARGIEGQRLRVEIAPLVHDIEKIARDTFLKAIDIRTSIGDALWTVLGDSTQLHQVLLNLCVNARDAMPHGGTLRLAAENITLDEEYAVLNPEAVPGQYVLLQVEDSGTGIPAAILEKIYEPFFTTKPVGSGTGLGLSTTLAIVKSHGGFIRVYTELGKGTRFKIFLPARNDAPEDQLRHVAALPRGNGEVVLLVDDEPSVRHVTQQTLEAFGYQVLLAANGTEAIALYATHAATIDVVLTDMTMPVMDGAATIRVLRKMNRAVKVICASGLTVNGEGADATDLGIRHFLAKPYTADTLLRMLRLVLQPTD